MSNNNESSFEVSSGPTFNLLYIYIFFCWGGQKKKEERKKLIAYGIRGPLYRLAVVIDSWFRQIGYGMLCSILMELAGCFIP